MTRLTGPTAGGDDDLAGPGRPFGGRDRAHGFPAGRSRPPAGPPRSQPDAPVIPAGPSAANALANSLAENRGPRAAR